MCVKCKNEDLRFVRIELMAGDDGVSINCRLQFEFIFVSPNLFFSFIYMRVSVNMFMFLSRSLLMTVKYFAYAKREKKRKAGRKNDRNGTQLDNLKRNDCRRKEKQNKATDLFYI